MCMDEIYQNDMRVSSIDLRCGLRFGKRKFAPNHRAYYYSVYRQMGRRLAHSAPPCQICPHALFLGLNPNNPLARHTGEGRNPA